MDKVAFPLDRHLYFERTPEFFFVKHLHFFADSQAEDGLLNQLSHQRVGNSCAVNVLVVHQPEAQRRAVEVGKGQRIQAVLIRIRNGQNRADTGFAEGSGDAGHGCQPVGMFRRMAFYQQAGNRSFVPDVIVFATNVGPRARAFKDLLNQCSHPMSKNRQVVGHDKIRSVLGMQG